LRRLLERGVGGVPARRQPDIHQPPRRAQGLVLHDVEHFGLQAWPQLGAGVKGLYLHFADYQMTDGRLVEIPPRAETVSQRHFYEKAIYVLRGAGYTTLQQEGRPVQRMDWRQGSLFAIPLNVLHQHFTTGDEPARLLMVTTFPMVLNLLNSEDFINHDGHAFTDRYDGDPDYSRRSEALGSFQWAANFVEDVRTAPTVRDPGSGNALHLLRWSMAGNSMLNMHVSEIPPKTHLKAHRHSSDAFILLLSGEGFSLAWPEAAWDDRVRVDWKAGTLFVPPNFWYHQHFNSSLAPARQLAINVPDVVANLGLNFYDQLEVDLDQVKVEWEQSLQQASEND
jgi:gentisate 1,2-dioxygenase